MVSPSMNTYTGAQFLDSVCGDLARREHFISNKMTNPQDDSGYVANNFIDRNDDCMCHNDWFAGNMPREEIKRHLLRDYRDGCFLVTNSTTDGILYTLSIFVKTPARGGLKLVDANVPRHIACGMNVNDYIIMQNKTFDDPRIMHYPVKRNAAGQIYIVESCSFGSLTELINHYEKLQDALPTRLKPPRTLCHYEIDSSRVKLCKKLGSGVFQATYRFALQKTQSVAVRMIRDNLSRDDFFQEARSMMKLHHPNLVQFIGVCSRGRLPMILMEYMPFNTLHSYLLTPRAKDEDPRILLDLCGQVCSAMSYLVMRHCIHRNLASRNCFIGARNIIKVGDVGRQRKSVVSRNTLVGDEREYFAWLSLETLEQSLFTHKSDVWAFGILMWEVFAFGEHPYGSLDCAAVTHFLQLGNRLDRPAKCPQNVFDMMQRCWDRNSGYRPTFEQLQEQLMDLKNDLVIEYKRPPRLPIYETHLN